MIVVLVLNNWKLVLPKKNNWKLIDGIYKTISHLRELKV
jgi:hypothetical protein